MRGGWGLKSARSILQSEGVEGDRGHRKCGWWQERAASPGAPWAGGFCALELGVRTELPSWGVRGASHRMCLRGL